MVVRRQKVKEYQEKEEGVNQGNGTRKDRKKEKKIYISFFSDFNGRISIGRTGILNMHCFQNEVHAGTYAILPL